MPVENYKLKTLETFLNIPREDTISGKESIHLYFKYMNSGDMDAKAKVLGHNYEDILHLIPFLKILEHFESSTINLYLPHRINISGHTFYLDTSRIQKIIYHLHSPYPIQKITKVWKYIITNLQHSY